MEKISKENIIANLKYMGLGEDGIFPQALHSFTPISFQTSRLTSDKTHRVFKFVPIDKIQILVTPTLRSDDIKDKFDKSFPLANFLNPEGSDDDVEKYAILLSIINKLQKSEIENIASLQKEIERKEPFKVKYHHDSFWQIYYSEPDDSYFMLVCTREQTFSEFLYLLKKKIEYCNNKGEKVPKIFVPINYVNYKGSILTNDEIADVENYLWVFTKNWPSIFEVYDKADKMSLQITGETFVYENIKSTYKMKFPSQDEALKFYKLLKALFIMTTEIKEHFIFSTRINTKAELEFYYDDIRVDYSGLEDFIRKEYLLAYSEILTQLEEAEKLEKDLNKIKQDCHKKEREYLDKQRQISTYLEYKKTFFGKMKFFIKGTKSLKAKTSVEDKIRNDSSLKQDTTSQIVLADMFDKSQEYYTLEDLVTIFNVKEKNIKIIKNIIADTKALKLKYENLVSKVKNATQYINEIDKHRKSIFDFWKFANKDEKLALEEGIEKEEAVNNNPIKRSFNLLEDLEELGITADRKQRQVLSQVETDSIFIANTSLLNVINMLRNCDMDKGELEIALIAIKEEFNKLKLVQEEAFDIFGDSKADNTKTRYIGAKAHREADKSKFKILGINKKIDVFDLTEKLSIIVDNLNVACSKMKSIYDMPLYKVVSITNNVREKDFDVYNMDVENALSNYHDDSDEGAINLIKINFKEGLPLIYYTNICMMDNTNQTLPEGMNLSTNVLLDCNLFNFKEVKQTKFRTNDYFNNNENVLYPRAKDVILFEYDVELKDNKKDDNKKEDDDDENKLADQSSEEMN